MSLDAAVGKDGLARVLSVGAGRSNAARLMSVFNYPYSIHYLFAALNLLNLAALQREN